MNRHCPPHSGLAANLARMPGWAIAATAQASPLVIGSSDTPPFDTEPLDTTQLPVQRER